MRCESPYYSKKFSVFFPCRNCLPCRIRRSRDWACRIVLEMSQHTHNTFLTLTYAPEYEPINGSLEPKHLQDLWKSVRKAGLKFRYFACGEYGTESFRPHYHAMLFGVDNFTAESYFTKFWKYGFISSYPASLATACYTAGYVTKKLSKNDILADCGMYPEFIRTSKFPAIGSNAIEQLLAINKSYNTDIDIFSQIRIGDKMFATPKYLKDKLRELFYDKEYIQTLKEARILSMQDKINTMIQKHFSDSTANHTFKEISLEANRKENAGYFNHIQSRQKIFNERKKV